MIMKRGEIKIVGTHHFLEPNKIKEIIDDYNPDITLVELCNGRITLIENPELEIQERFSILGWIVKSIRKKAELEGKEYGSDMVTAYKYSKEKNIPVGLIDRPVVETKVLMKAIPFSEKLMLLKELKKFKSKEITLDKIIGEVENSNTEEIINMIKSKAPNLHYYLIQSRDEYMINKIKGYLYDHPDKKILIFVGKGHQDKIEKEILKPIEEVKGGNEK